MNTEHLPEFQESLSADISELIHSVLQAHGPDTGLEHSTSQIRFPCSTLYGTSDWIPFTLHSLLSSLCCMPHTLSCRDKAVQFLPFTGLM
jgi:hypothetical protein